MDHFDGGGFSSAVGSQKAEALPGTDRKIYPLDSRKTVIFLYQAPRPDNIRQSQSTLPQ
jgi:hypothetical protein